MKDFIKKIVNSFLAIVIALGIIVAVNYIAEHESRLLSAFVIGDVDVNDIELVEFVTPNGSVYPVNGVVTIQTVTVGVDTSVPDDNVPDEFQQISGSDLIGSPISFSQDPGDPCPAGTTIVNNKVYLPSTFTSSCSIQIDTSVSSGISTTSLVIEPISCSALQTSILRGQGSGFENLDPADLGSFATSDPFDFTTITSSVDLTYPSTTVDGARTFQIHVELAPDIATDSINGIESRAEIVSNSGDGEYEIKIRNEGTGNEAQTGLNFAYVFNDLLGADSPFIAYPSGADTTQIVLQAVEMGTHPNSGYVCVEDGTEVGPPCFAGGTAGIGAATDVLTIPLTLDNEVLQGESAIVFAGNSAGEIQWISSHPSVMEVVTLSEAAQDNESTIDFVDVLLDDTKSTENAMHASGSYNITNCQQQFDEDTNAFISETCAVEATVPVQYDTFTTSYTVNVSIGDEVVPVTVDINQLNGTMTGTGSYTTLGGVDINLTGFVTGTVSGSVTGQYSGTVNGQITAPISGSISVASPGAATPLDSGYIKTNLVPSAPPVVEGTLHDVPDSFTSTVKKDEADISHVAILYAKRPGTSILSAIDDKGCIASFDIDVIEKKVILQMVGRDPADVLDVSDTVQINAFEGGANMELDEYENITAASGIEWFSSNEEVATIDNTGLLTALKPGVTNITARYDTGDAEIGTIESNPLQVTVNKIAKLRVSFDSGTEDLLPAATVDAAYESVIIAIHNPEAAGQTMLVEGESVNITLTSATYTNEISKVENIADNLAAAITAVAGVNGQAITVTRIDGYPGMLILQPLNQTNTNGGVEEISENGKVDITTTALETDLSILPTYSNAIPLPTSETYGLMVIAQYDNGATKVLPPTQFTWMNTPVNYLEQASLDTGLIRMGEITGTSTVVAEYENADGSVVRSNYLTITVDSGPVIDYVRRIGSNSITKGSRINLQMKVSDVDTIDDITSISTSLVYSTYSTYQQINEDSTAIWFTAVPFLNEVSVVSESSGTEGEDGGDGTTTTTTTTQALQYKIFDIPIEIPVNSNLFDGNYKLVISVTDASNHTLNYVYPLRIGEIGAGDVDNDGDTDMIDVIKAFRIATGLNASPTPAELAAANVDGVGGVTLVDVILLFNQVSNKP